MDPWRIYMKRAYTVRILCIKLPLHKTQTLIKPQYTCVYVLMMFVNFSIFCLKVIGFIIRVHKFYDLKIS